MPVYRVVLHGTGIRIPSQESGQEIIGFYTTRLVQASNEDQAVGKACEKVRAQWSSGRYAKSNLGTLPKLCLESVKRTSFLDFFFFKATGHSFYAGDHKATS